MPDALNAQITDTLSTVNAKAVAEKGAVLSNMGLENAVNAQQLATNNSLTAQKRLDGILESAMGQVIRTINESDLADQLSQLNAALSANQQQNKVAGVTPPVTISGTQ